MPILVICQNNVQVAYRVQGFTLIELIVVLVFMGMASAVAFPNMAKMFDGFVLRTERDAVVQELAALGVRAYTRRTAVILSEENAVDLLDLPEHWRVILPGPIYYGASGFCGGGEISLVVGQQRRTYDLAPPYCEPREL